MTTQQLYRVDKAEHGSRQPLTSASTLEMAQARLDSITRNMEANGYLRTDNTLLRKLPVVMLAKDRRVIALMVTECDASGLTDNYRELAEMPWLTRVPAVCGGIEELNDYTVDSDITPADGIYGRMDHDHENHGGRVTVTAAGVQ